MADERADSAELIRAILEAAYGPRHEHFEHEACARGATLEQYLAVAIVEALREQGGWPPDEAANGH